VIKISHIIRIFGLMLDRVQEGYSSSGDFANSSLFGTNGKKDQLDLLLALLHMKERVLNDFVPSLGLDAHVTEAL
jgi:hypothetical protein